MNCIRKTFYILLFLLLLASQSYADSRVIEGVSFDVDELNHLDDGMWRVTIVGETQLVDDDGLDSLIVRNFFAKKDSLISARHFRLFVTNSLNDGKINWALLAFSYAYLNKDFSEIEIITFFNSLEDSTNKEIFAKKLLSYQIILNRPHTVANVLLYLANSGELKNILTYEYINKNEKILGEDFENVFLIALRDHDVAKVKEILVLEKAIFGNAGYYHQLHADWFDSIEQARQGMKKDDYGSVVSLVNKVKFDRTNKALTPLVTELIHQTTEKLLQKGEYAKVLNILGLLDKNVSTETTYNILHEALVRIINESVQVKIGNPAHDLCQSFSTNPSFKKLYTKFLVSQFEIALENFEFNKANGIFKNILFIRPDPSTENDVLRCEYALKLHKAGNVSDAKTKISEIQTYIPFLYKVRFFFLGMYFSWMQCLIILAIVFSLCVIYKVLKPKKHKKTASGKKYSKSNNKSKSDNSFDSNFTVLRGNYKMDEYVRLLSEFGLGKDADLKTIKMHYRKIIKAYHPDMHPNQSEEDNKKFIMTKERYERILALRSELGLPD